MPADAWSLSDKETNRLRGRASNQSVIQKIQVSNRDLKNKDALNAAGHELSRLLFFVPTRPFI